MTENENVVEIQQPAPPQNKPSFGKRFAAGLKERGMKRFSVDELARNLHISKKTIYDLFDSKKSLVESAVEYMLSELASDVENIGQSEPNSLRGLVYSIMAGVKFFCTMPSHTYSEIRECAGKVTGQGETIIRLARKEMDRTVWEE